MCNFILINVLAFFILFFSNNQPTILNFFFMCPAYTYVFHGRLVMRLSSCATPPCVPWPFGHATLSMCYASLCYGPFGDATLHVLCLRVFLAVWSCDSLYDVHPCVPGRLVMRLFIWCASMCSWPFGHATLHVICIHVFLAVWSCDLSHKVNDAARVSYSNI